MSKILIVCYSWSGNTKTVAAEIERQTGSRLFEIQPVKAYPRIYNACTEQAKREIHNGFLPPLKAMPDNLADHDVIFVGTPNWWSTMAPPVMSVLNRSDLTGKTIVPFITHGGGGKGRFVQDLKLHCPQSTILEDLAFFNDGGRTAGHEISAWLERLKLTAA